MLRAGPDSGPGPREQAAGSARWTFITAIFAVFVFNLDLFVVNVALPSISHDFHGASLSSLSWVLNVYTIVFAALLVVAGRIADRGGHRKWFLIGLAVFTLGSALCAVAPDVALLVIARVVQATGAAVLMPTSLALVLATTSPARRPVVVRAWTAVGGVAAVMGPLIGGLLVQYSWRWVFVINIPAGIAAIIIGRRVLPDVRGDEHGPLPDVLGAAFLTLAVGALALGLVKSGSWGPGSIQTIGTFVAAAVLIVAFFVRSAHHPSPIVELPMLRVPAFSGATLSALLFNAVFAAVILAAVQWCQHVWGYSALRTGLALAPGPLLMPPFAVLAGPLGKRIGNGMVAALGNLVLGAGILWWIVVAGPKPSYLGALLPGLLIGGIGIGLALPTLIAAAATALPANRFATGSGVLNTARQIGAVIGVGIVVRILGTQHTFSAEVTAFRHGWIALLVICCAAAAACLVLMRRPAAAAGTSAVSEPRDVASTVGADGAAAE
jgi:EmrB/QacA subfamily drug resistance transporter